MFLFAAQGRYCTWKLNMEHCVSSLCLRSIYLYIFSISFFLRCCSFTYLRWANIGQTHMSVGLLSKRLFLSQSRATTCNLQLQHLLFFLRVCRLMLSLLKYHDSRSEANQITIYYIVGWGERNQYIYAATRLPPHTVTIHNPPLRNDTWPSSARLDSPLACLF